MNIIIPSITTQIVSIQLSNRDTPGQIDSFFSSFSLKNFVRLKSLTLIKVTSNETMNKILMNLSFVKHLSYLSIIDSGFIANDIHENMCKIIFVDRYFKYLTYCQLSYYKLPSTITTSIPTCNIKQLTIRLNYFNDLVSLLDRCPQIQKLTAAIPYKAFITENEEIISIYPVTSLRYMKLDLGYHILFNKFELLCEKLPNIKYLSCSALGLSFTDGERWQNLIMTCFPSLFEFDLLFEVGYTSSSAIDITNIIKKFQTQFWLDRNKYFICDYRDQRMLALYSTPYNKTVTAPLMNIYETTSSVMMIYDKVEKLFLKFSTTRHLNTQRIYPNVSTLILLNEDDKGEISTIPFPSSPFVSDIGKIIVWENIRNLSYLCYNYELMVDIMKYATNITSLDLCVDYFKNMLSDNICPLFINIKRLELVDGRFEMNTIEKLSKLFPQLEHLTIDIENNYELYTILPLLVANIRNMSYLSIEIHSNTRSRDQIEYWLRSNILFINFSIEFNEFRLRLWSK
ncbi:unnamed protein product [Didymodactylos carnosus]|nr:unnamed protein product [Didymodactylos carnosus]CAF3689653.1 unnamed protein product [Didymodactylos carnosus]